MNLEPLTAISPLDGRYRSRVAHLAEFASEFALIRYRVRVEVEWFVFLAGQDEVADLPALDSATQKRLHAVWRDFSPEDAAAVRAIEARTNHDVKAVEYFVKEAVAEIPDVAPHIEFVHFACTSEDINNLAYALMLQDVREQALTRPMRELAGTISELAAPLADVPMLARTHGQAASPTTVGKELANVAARLRGHIRKLEDVGLCGKMNGAVGNYNAHLVAYPDIDWPAKAQQFVEGLGLAFNPYTTQIEPHDYIAELCHAVMRFNQTLLDFDRDIWGYIALGYFRQRKVEGETGSSTMPHKVNPIDFENSEGNLGIANALLGHLADKLPVSRWQRDLSDSTALRSLGPAFGHCVVAYSSAQRGIGKLEIDTERLATDVDQSWEVLSEAVQTVLRASGGKEPYETLKALTRGQSLNRDVYLRLLADLDLTEQQRERLAALTPATYVGAAERLAKAATAPAVVIREVLWNDCAKTLRAIREEVFIREQNVPIEEEWDGRDEGSRHFLAEVNGKPVGTTRLLTTGQIGRMAVLQNVRGMGIGRLLLDAAVTAARQGDHPEIFLEAQTHAIEFYRKAGFRANGPTFMDAGIPHQRMTLSDSKS